MLCCILNNFDTFAELLSISPMASSGPPFHSRTVGGDHQGGEM